MREGAVQVRDEEIDSIEDLTMNEESTKMSYLDFETEKTSTVENLAFSLKETINYGRFHVLLK